MERIISDSFRISNKSREAKQECLRRISQTRRTHRAESDCSALPGEAARFLGVLPTPPPLPDLSNPGLFIAFFRQSLDFAVFPHKSRRPMAIGAGSKSKARAWRSISKQICVNALRPAWRHRPLVGQLCIIFADLFHKIGVCRLPTRFGPTVAPQLFEC